MTTDVIQSSPILFTALQTPDAGVISSSSNARKKIIMYTLLYGGPAEDFFLIHTVVNSVLPPFNHSSPYHISSYLYQ